MKTFAIIIPYKFKASKNILENLEKLKLPKNVEVVKVEKESIDNEDLDKEIKADYFIFATRHQSVQKIKSLCVHPPGNFLENEIGGKKKELDFAMPCFMKIALNYLNENKIKDFEATMEATHHGPYLKKPVMFIEIGSTEKEWEDKEAGMLIAKTILEVVKNDKKFKACIVLGGGHYNQTANKVMLNTEYAVGHICPKYQLENLNEKMLKQMSERSENKIELAILDWKGLGKYKQKVTELLEKIKLEYKRYDKL